MPRPVVADASALLPAWLPAERHQAQADLLIQLHAAGGIQLCAPPLLAHETLNALYLAVRGKADAPPRLTEEVRSSDGSSSVIWASSSLLLTASPVGSSVLLAHSSGLASTI